MRAPSLIGKRTSAFLQPPAVLLAVECQMFIRRDPSAPPALAYRQVNARGVSGDESSSQSVMLSTRQVYSASNAPHERAMPDRQRLCRAHNHKPQPPSSTSLLLQTERPHHSHKADGEQACDLRFGCLPPSVVSAPCAQGSPQLILFLVSVSRVLTSSRHSTLAGGVVIALTRLRSLRSAIRVHRTAFTTSRVITKSKFAPRPS